MLLCLQFKSLSFNLSNYNYWYWMCFISLSWKQLLAPANRVTTSRDVSQGLFFSLYLFILKKKKKIKPSSLSVFLPVCLPLCAVMDVYQGGGTVCLEELCWCQQGAAEQRNKHRLWREEAGAKCSTLMARQAKSRVGWRTDAQTSAKNGGEIQSRKLHTWRRNTLEGKCSSGQH